jgi:hypothetical protein
MARSAKDAARALAAADKRDRYDEFSRSLSAVVGALTEPP